MSKENSTSWHHLHQVRPQCTATQEMKPKMNYSPISGSTLVVIEIRLRNKILRETGHLFPVGDVVLDPSTEQWLHLNVDCLSLYSKQSKHLKGQL